MAKRADEDAIFAVCAILEERLGARIEPTLAAVRQQLQRIEAAPSDVNLVLWWVCLAQAGAIGLLLWWVLT